MLSRTKVQNLSRRHHLLTVHITLFLSYMIQRMQRTTPPSLSICTRLLWLPSPSSCTYSLCYRASPSLSAQLGFNGRNRQHHLLFVLKLGVCSRHRCHHAPSLCATMIQRSEQNHLLFLSTPPSFCLHHHLLFLFTPPSFCVTVAATTFSQVAFYSRHHHHHLISVLKLGVVHVGMQRERERERERWGHGENISQ
ncbi:hypothetical protein L7F22_055917 [Adiantum nelumboides]|nr:hypothetical protein [Adiantum nelumboides]